MFSRKKQDANPTLSDILIPLTVKARTIKADPKLQKIEPEKPTKRHTGLYKRNGPIRLTTTKTINYNGAENSAPHNIIDAMPALHQSAKGERRMSAEKPTGLYKRNGRH